MPYYFYRRPGIPPRSITGENRWQFTVSVHAITMYGLKILVPAALVALLQVRRILLGFATHVDPMVPIRMSMVVIIAAKKRTHIINCSILAGR